jgi:aminoglycoside phosphotransferase (APT) family kinase protein
VTTEATPVRPGEELNKERLAEYLRSHFSAGLLSIEILQFPAGSSNLTYLITSGDGEFVLRRPPFGNTVKTAHDMSREFEVLLKLSKVYAPAPKPLLYCEDASIIGSEFYLMERRKGLIIRGSTGQYRPRERVAESRKRGEVGKTRTLENSHGLRLDVCKSFIQNLADLHALDYEAADLGSLGRPEGYCRRQVEGWTRRYFAAKTDDHIELEKAIKWLNENVPSESGDSLVHNDYKFDNIILDPDDLTHITAVLDWEMVTIGDPLMDLGTTLGYWMSAEAGEEMMSMPFNPHVLMANISRRELADMYSEFSGRDISNILYYYIFGTFKIAVIAQQIYARYLKGSTKDMRFARFDRFAGRLGTIAAAAMSRGSL